MSDTEERNMLIKKTFITLCCLFAPPLLIVLPFWIIEKVMKYDISASDWLAFYGAYIGILIGSLSVIITIYFTNKEARLDRNHSDNQFTEQLRSSKMPYITFFHNSAKKPDHRIDLNNLFDIEIYSKSFRLFLKNIGNGHATDFRISYIKFESENYV